jgi:hypothetical protein
MKYSLYNSPFKKVALPSLLDVVDDICIALRIHVRHTRLGQRQPVLYINVAERSKRGERTCKWRSLLGIA